MTDKEKAKNISKVNARQYRHNYGGEEFVFSNEECETSALDMAEWKDNILREEREKAIEKFNEYYDNHLSLSMSSRYAGIVFLVDKLLGEDSRDRLHCAFVTLDDE